MKRLLVVAGLIRGKADGPEASSFLLSRRLKEGHLAGWWEFPGGKVEAGEAPVDALRRELHEELGIHVDVGDVYAVGHHVYEDREVILMVYECELVAGEPRCIEVLEYRWVSPEALCEMRLPPADDPVVERVRRDWGLQC